MIASRAAGLPTVPPPKVVPVGAMLETVSAHPQIAIRLRVGFAATALSEPLPLFTAKPNRPKPEAASRPRRKSFTAGPIGIVRLVVGPVGRTIVPLLLPSTTT